MPMLRAVPSTVRMAASMESVLRSTSLVWAISRTCARVTLPILSLCGTAEALAMPAARLSRIAAGGVLTTKVKDRSWKIVTTTGRIRPSCEPVWALKPLQNSMMLTPCWPSAGPTGGEGLALPAGICSFTTACTFFISEPFDLVVLELDRGQPPEDGHHDLELPALGIEIVDGALEVDERPLDHPHLVPLLEGGLELGLLGALLHLAQDALDFFGRQRHRLRARAHEARDLRRGSHQMPRVVGELHFDQQVAGEELLLRFDLLTAPDLPHLLRRHDDAAEHILEAEALGPGLDPLPHLLLETGVSVDHEPRENHVHQPQVQGHNEDQGQHHHRGRRHFGATGPVHPSKLGRHVAKKLLDVPQKLHSRSFLPSPPLIWQAWRDLNPHPPDLESGALAVRATRLRAC